MEDILLQTIIDKLESLEKTSEELNKALRSVTNYNPAFKEVNEKIRMVQMEVRGIPKQISIPGKEIQALRISMESLTTQLKQPLEQKVKHVHYVDTPLLLCIAMTSVIIGLSFWINILLGDIHRIEKVPYDHSVTIPSYIPQKQVISKSQKLKPKIPLVKGNSQDSFSRQKQMLNDSIYKLLMHNYEQNRAGKQTTAAEQQSNNSQPK